MKSINGFNNSSLQGSSNISSINSIGTGVDIAKTAMSNDVHFQTSTGGTSYSLPQQVYDFSFEYKQFDCIVQKWKDPENPEAAPEYRLRCVIGLTSFENYNVDEQGFIKNDEFIWNHRLSLWNVWPTGTSYIDEDDESQTFLDNGYIKLEKNKNYKVFIYKINPSVEEWPESLSAQIAIIEEGSPADANVKSKYNGGGAMQSYIVSAETTSNNVVTADPLSGKIANFDAYDLNGAVTFNADLIEVVLKEGTMNEASLTWLSGNIPVFAKESYNPYEDYDIDGNIIAGVPFGTNWASYGTGNPIGLATNIPEPGGTANVYYWFGEDDVHNSIWNSVVVAQEMSGGYNIVSPTFGNYVSGAVDPHFIELKAPDKVPGENQGVVEFEHTDLDIIASSQTSITAATLAVPTGKPKGNVGFSEFDCARKEIAYIKWVASDPENPTAGGRFDVYQINNGPINFNYKPILNNIKKVATQGEAHWGTTNDSWVSPDIVEFMYWGDVEDALSESKFRENSSDIGGFLPVKPTRTSG